MCTRLTVFILLVLIKKDTCNQSERKSILLLLLNSSDTKSFVLQVCFKKLPRSRGLAGSTRVLISLKTFPILKKMYF